MKDKYHKHYLGKEIFHDLLVVVSVIIVFIGVLEVFSYFIYVNNHVETEAVPFLHDVQKDSYYGYVLIPNNTYSSLKQVVDGPIIYNATYSIDNYGRRKIVDSYNSLDNHIILFGGSVAYGEGLSDNETLQYYLYNYSGENVYSYSVPGYGPSQMLAKLELGFEKGEVVSNNGKALYIFIPAHVNRVIGNTLAWWLYDGRYYDLENDTLVNKGSFSKNRTEKTDFYKFFNTIKSKSFFLKEFDINFPLRISDEDIELTARVIERSKQLYEENFNGEFYVVFHPEWNLVKNKKNYLVFKEYFEKLEINVLDYSTFDYTDNYTIPYDHHPTAQLNKKLAGLIYNDLY